MWSSSGQADPVQPALHRDVRPARRSGAAGQHRCGRCCSIASRRARSPAIPISTSPICWAASPRARPSPACASTRAATSPSSTRRSRAAAGWRRTRTSPSGAPADRQRIAMKEQEARRATVEAALASFRERVESVLAVVTTASAPCATPRTGCSARPTRPRSAPQAAVRRLERGLHQRRDRRRRGRRTVELDRRDQRAARPHHRGRARRGRARPKPPTARSPGSPRRRRRSATSSS